MKRIILSIAIVTISLQLLASDPSQVTERVLNTFKNTFHNVKDISWNVIDNSIYQVKFRVADMKLQVEYDKDGNVLRSIRYYSGNLLPVTIATKLKKAYPKQTIYAVIEEATEDGTYYHVTMEDEKQWYMIKADIYGSILEKNKYFKA